MCRQESESHTDKAAISTQWTSNHMEVECNEQSSCHALLIPFHWGRGWKPSSQFVGWLVPSEDMHCPTGCQTLFWLQWGWFGWWSSKKRYKLPVVLEEQTSDNLKLNVSAPIQELDLESWESFGSDLWDLALQTAGNSPKTAHQGIGPPETWSLQQKVNLWQFLCSIQEEINQPWARLQNLWLTRWLRLSH